jgi:hypothetical protein
MEWEIIRQDNDVFIAGPGALDIALYDFDPGKVRLTEYTAEELGETNGLFEDRRYRFWEYEMSPGVLLILFTSWDAKAPGSGRHYLELNHKGWHVRWEFVPGAFAEELHGLSSPPNIRIGTSRNISLRSHG